MHSITKSQSQSLDEQRAITRSTSIRTALQFPAPIPVTRSPSLSTTSSSLNPPNPSNSDEDDILMIFQSNITLWLQTLELPVLSSQTRKFLPNDSLFKSRFTFLINSLLHEAVKSNSGHDSLYLLINAVTAAPASNSVTRKRLIYALTGQWDLLQPQDYDQKRPTRNNIDLYRISSFAKAGNYSKLLHALKTPMPSLHPTDPRFKIELQSLFPTANLPTMIPIISEEILNIQIKTVKSALSRSKSASAPGRSGLRISYLKLCGDIILPALTLFLNCLLRNSTVSGFTSDTVGILFEKAPGKFRPIAISEDTVRLLGRCILPTANVSPTDSLSPMQYAVGRRGAMQAAIIASTHALSDLPDHLLIQTDVANAFNTISRNSIREALITLNNPIISRFFNLRYTSASGVYSRENSFPLHEITSGVTQGCPMSMFLFCLGLKQILIQLRTSPSPPSLICSYADDISLVCKKENASILISQLTGNLREIGLMINVKKSTIFVPKNCSADVNTIAPLSNFSLTRHGIILLGTPVGSFDFITDFLQQKRHEATEALDLIVSCRAITLQTKFLMIRSSIVPRLTHLSRTVLPIIMSPILVVFDKIIRKMIAALLLIPDDSLDDPTSPVNMILELPRALGGIEIPQTTPLTELAYMACFFESFHIAPELRDFLNPSNLNSELQKTFDTTMLKLHAWLDELPLSRKTDLNSPTTANLKISGKKCQQQLTEVYHAHRSHLLEKLLLKNITTTSPSSVTIKKEAIAAFRRHISQGQEGASDWLHSIPSDPLLTIDDDILRISLLRVLGINYIPDLIADESCFCWRGHQITLTHTETCMQSGQRQTAHNNLVNVIHFISIKMAKMTVVKEPRHLLGTEKRPDLHFTTQNAFFDIGITSPGQIQFSAMSSLSQPLIAASHMADAKRKKYTELVANTDPLASFSPAIFESTGARDKTANGLLLMLLRNLPYHTKDFHPNGNWSCTLTSSFLRQVLSVSVVRGISMASISMQNRNALSLSNRPLYKRKSSNVLF